MLPQLSPQQVTNSSIDYEFVSQVFVRFFKIMLRSDKKIKMIYSDYSNKHSLGNNFYVLNFRFRNAIWYKINNQRTEKRQFIFSENESPENIEIIVYGFFRKKSFKMNLAKSLSEEKVFEKFDKVESQYSL
ncbi:hypothetical protein ACFPVY_08090 [Flavobacterium qiangtangense]|uniref:WYL domain-containing protein n=1 Tax=Flavobacterium qiangtangense TaxID=1442595 RepID=A0ABW1PMW8_9FLAO